MGKGGKNEVKQFTGMWPLKPGFSLEEITSTLVKTIRRGVALERGIDRIDGRWRVGKIHPSHEGAIFPEDIGFGFFTGSPAQAIQVIVSSPPDAVTERSAALPGDIER